MKPQDYGKWTERITVNGIVTWTQGWVPGPIIIKEWETGIGSDMFYCYIHGTKDEGYVVQAWRDACKSAEISDKHKADIIQDQTLRKRTTGCPCV